jgi:hypothetical protein
MWQSNGQNLAIEGRKCGNWRDHVAIEAKIPSLWILQFRHSGRDCLTIRSVFRHHTLREFRPFSRW